VPRALLLAADHRIETRCSDKTVLQHAFEAYGKIKIFGGEVNLFPTMVTLFPSVNTTTHSIEPMIT